jgi:hypothetical protein
MNDVYCEYIVKRKTGTWAMVCRYLVIVSTVFAIYFGIVALQFLGLFGGLLLIYLSIYVFRNTDIEYEYQFISGHLDIDVIFAKKKRKRARKFDIRTVEVFAPSNSDVFKQYEHYKNDRSYKVVDYSSGYPDREKYAFIVSMGEKGVAKVIFEPNEKMVEAIRTYIPSKMHK